MMFATPLLTMECKCQTCHGYVADGVMSGGCSSWAMEHLMDLCMHLPDEECLPAPMNTSKCGKDEFDCGDGECIHGLQICDNKYDCSTGADELQW